MKPTPLYKKLSGMVIQMDNLEKSGQSIGRVTQEFTALCKEYLPSGSGVDTGTSPELAECEPDKLVFSCSFHHMDEYGGYDGWTDHTVTVTPSLFSEISVHVSGDDDTGIAGYLEELFYDALRQTVEQ